MPNKSVFMVVVGEHCVISFSMGSILSIVRRLLLLYAHVIYMGGDAHVCISAMI